MAGKPAKRRPPKVVIPDAVGPDPCDPFTPEDVDLDDPFERAAIALSLLTWNTPEDVPAMFANQRDTILQSWCGPNDVDAIRWRKQDRNLYRRRAAAVLRAYGGLT